MWPPAGRSTGTLRGGPLVLARTRARRSAAHALAAAATVAVLAAAPASAAAATAPTLRIGPRTVRVGAPTVRLGNVVAALAGPSARCHGAGTRPAARARAGVLCLVNAARAAARLRGLRTDSRLSRAAAAQARDMAHHHYFAH